MMGKEKEGAILIFSLLDIIELRWAGGLWPPREPFGPSLASDAWEALCQSFYLE